MKNAWLNGLWLGSGNAVMFPWLRFKTPLWQLQSRLWWALMFCLCNEPPPPPQLKCNYHLADTKMCFLACGHSRCYLEFLNFRRGNRKEKKSFSLPLSLACRPTFRGWAGKEEEKNYARGEEGEEEEEEERDDRIRGEGKRFWEDAIMRTVNSETGCERQRLAR